MPENKKPAPQANTVVIELSQPCKWGDGEITELQLDLDGLTGDDLAKAESVFFAMNPGFTGVPSVTAEYSMCLAAQVAGRPVDDIKALPIQDCLKINRVIDGFLYG